MPSPVYAAYGGLILTAVTIVMLALVMLFGDLFLKSDRDLQKWMDAILWCMAGGLSTVSVATAWAVIQLHH